MVRKFITNIFYFYSVFYYLAGLFELKPGTILFARPLREDGIYNEENDIAEAWCLDGYVPSRIFQCLFTYTFMTMGSNEFLTNEEITQLDVVRDLFLGPADEITSEAPIPNPDKQGELMGGTAFERCGQHAVKESGRCYSLTMSHQRPRALVGPTSSGKYYENLEEDNCYSLNLDIRGKVTEVRPIPIFEITLTFFKQINAHMAMMALKIGAPNDYMQLLKEHADIVNLPRVGVDDNVAFPAVQANVAPAVGFDQALGIKSLNFYICCTFTYPYFR